MASVWRRIFGRDESRAGVTMSSQPAAQFGVEIPPELTEAMTAGGAIAQRISRNEALQVPAVLRGRNLICSTLAGLPLRVHDPERRQVDGYLLGGNIDPDVANVVTLANTIEDLLFEGIAWWRVTRFGWHGFPVEAQWVPESHVSVHGTMGHPATSQVSPDQVEPRTGQVFIDGVPVPDREVIRFDSPNPPLLRHAARAIRTALKLDTAAGMYAEHPVPLGSLQPAEGAEPLSADPGSAGDGSDRSEVDALLDSWEAARRRRVWAYLQKVTVNSLQWDPAQLQLAEQRQHAVLEIARAIGVDPEDLGVSTTSRTYQNSEHRRQDLLDFTLAAYVQALEQRLSMRDILPRRYEAKLSFDGFLRTTTPTRMETYRVGREVGVYDDQRIADLEDLPVEQVRRAREQAAAPQRSETREAPEMARDKPELRLVNGAKFEAEPDAVRVHFDTDEVAESFQVDSERRTITGLAVPWGKVARSGFSKWRFAPDSLRWSDASRVKLNLNHDFTQLIGRATRLQSGSRGLMSTFKVAKGPEGDRALALAEDQVYDGFSIEVDFNDDLGDSWQPDPSDESVRLVTQASLRGTALTGMPAFEDARVTRVSATRDGGGIVPEEKKAPENGQGTGTVALQADEFTKFMGGLAEKLAESHQALTTELGNSIGESVAAGFKSALESIHDPQRDGPESVRAARFAVTREAPVYTFDGRGPSLVRDAWYAGREHDSDAQERIRRFHGQSAEMQKLAAGHVAAKVNGTLGFDTVTTGTASEIIPPGYRPDLFVPQLAQGRPLYNMLSRGTISNATPFVVPTFGSLTDGTGDHTEGQPPVEGTLVLGSVTVTPGAVSGKLPLTREIVDSSNPAVDQIALAAMRESYAQQTETKVYAELNGSADGANTEEYAEASVILDTRDLLARYPFVRFAAPTGAAMNQKVTRAFATSVGEDGRPLLPSVGAQNTAGLGNAVNQGWFIDGLTFVPAWSMTDDSEDDVALILNSMDAWAWESPTLAFRFEEKQGPEIIELALFGYFAVHVLRPSGVFAIRNPV